ncbi:MAG: ArsR/SmtB family transcription factor [Enterococcus casseliflavus]
MELDLSKEALPIYEALASQTRLSMLRYIGNEKKSISEIAQALQISNAITTRHVQQMEDAGLLDSERGTGTNRNKKLVFLKTDDIYIRFPARINQPYKAHAIDLNIGHFTDFSVKPTCGLATVRDVVGKPDDPKYFLDSERVNAGLLWFSKGFVEYKIPNLLQESETPELLEISLELASEFPLSNNLWPSDISIFINDVKVAVYTVPGNFSDTRGRYTPLWWNDRFSQYGLLKHLRINKQAATIDGEVCSNVTIDTLHLSDSPFIKLRLAIEKDAKNQGGLTLFGKGFGNHNQNIQVDLYYSE